MTPPDEHPRVRVVTLNYNGGPLTLACLASLRATEWPADRLQIVLVDNASRDGIVDVVRQRWPDIEIVESDVNRGFAGGSNLGIGDLADCDYVALVNNDVTVTPGWLAPMVEVLEADDQLGAACPKILFASRYLDVELRSSTTQLGRGDHRDLGAHVLAVELDGADVTDRIQWVRGFWGHEAPGTEPGQWSCADSLFRLPVERDAPAPRTVRLRLAAAAPGTATVRAGGEPVTVALTIDPSWCDIPVGGEPVDIVNNVGSVLTEHVWGADRGYLEPDEGQYDEPAEVFAWCGGAVLLSARYLREVGTFDERLFLYYEDFELSWRGAKRGWRYRYVPASLVHHVHSATVDKASGLARYQNERNRLLVLTRHADPGTLTTAVLESLAVTASYARRDVASPMLRGERPHAGIVRDRVRAFGGFLALLPAMVSERQRDRRSEGQAHG